ncbi:periplasmic sensor signal transduction histidine kinase [Thioalkalivibrio sulfidiphilus HL-EbGr7]|uniref:histidine kinase n=1 Tax=Thioalkalivibrio sulfidiphilus (strain HL-EbGR7) TaxID=396588 RepID=B8GLC2_THISH|nr:XrtA/PEP-CTERM system histidine kinase PrsK [Thioalkalivibrio sulfidiphilus]ACL73477.1 periplasmic sensor signal transduction histidine kinase [Thioalkalivibrio sulfidiphilus HL-EbGr7]
MNIGLTGYLLSAIAFSALLAILLIGWRRPGPVGHVLMWAVAVSVLWSVLFAWQWSRPVFNPGFLFIIEVFRDSAWLGFLWLLNWKATGPEDRARRYLAAIGLVAGVIALALVVRFVISPAIVSDEPLRDLLLLGKLGLALCLLVMIEHLLRSTSSADRWQVKYVALGLGCVYVFEFYIHAEALMLGGMSQHMLDARGYIFALMAPLIAISAARNPRWELDVFVSRGVVFQGVTLMAAGLYLVIMAAAGYYVRVFGGDWGTVLQVVFLFAALMVLVGALLSERLRARLRVFVSKHFFSYRFDYRDEWLRFIATMSATDSHEDLPVRVIRALANIVDSGGGQIWLRDGGRTYQLAGAIGMPGQVATGIAIDDPLPVFLHDSEWIVDLPEYLQYPERYGNLVLPSVLDDKDAVWLIVPLFHDQDLMGFVVLMPSLSVSRLTWEERDLLKTAGLQAATHLAQLDASRALAEVRQFEGFNRLSAYVLHDLKNLIAQLSLVVSNARRHGDNPAFLKDAIATVENAVNRMNRLMEQLRNGDVEPRYQIVDLVDLSIQAVNSRSTHRPVPELEVGGGPFVVRGVRDRLLSVINHLIQNAQEATPPDGEVRVYLWRDADQVYLSVKDTGCGMDADFVRNRLFKPFDTTKGLTGMGIGAYECRELVRFLGGNVQVKSEPGKGTEIQIQLPSDVGDRSGITDATR